MINNFFADSVIMILFLHITALYFQNGFILKKINYRSNVKNLGVLNLVLVFFAIICRLLPRSTTTDSGHEHIQRDNSFSIAQQAAVEKDEDGEEAEEVLEKSKEETEEEEEEVVEKKKEPLLRSAQNEAVDEDGEEAEVVLEKSKEELEEEEVEKKRELLRRSAQQAAVEEDMDCKEVEVVLGKSKEEPKEEVVEKKKKDLEESEKVEVKAEKNEENGPRPHRSKTKGEHHHLYHHHHYHRLCHRYHQITINQQQPSVGNERSNKNSSQDPRKESFPAPEERIFHYNQVNRYQYAPLHRPDPSTPPVPESYYTQYTSNPRTTRRGDASTSPPKQTLQSKKNPLPLPPPRRRKEREERRISSQSKKAKKGESGRFRFQSVTLPNAGLQPPQLPAPPSSPAPPPLGPCNLHKNTRPSSPIPQNLKRTTNQGTPPPTMTNTSLRRREQNTDSYPKKVIYVETGNQSPLNGIAQPPPPLPFPNRGMKFVAHGDLVNIQSSSSDSVDDPPSTPCYYSSSDINNKAKIMIPRFHIGSDPSSSSSSSSTTNSNYVNYETSSYPPHSPPEFYTMHPVFPPSRIAV